jgi:methionyl-tRNA formyltransferase
VRIVYAGTPDFAVPALQALLASSHEVVAVYTQPDRPAGRGRKLKASPVKAVAVAADIPVMQPETLKTAEAQAALAAFEPDLMVVAAYGLLLPVDVLETPRHGCVNIHASLLPRWRGAAPIHRAILAGDAETGITIMQMDAGLDTGDMLLRKAVPIGDRETTAQLHDTLAALGAEALIEVLPAIEASALEPQPQNDAEATYASKLQKAEALVDWRQPAVEIDRKVRAFNPWPVAQTPVAKGMLRIHAAEPEPGVSRGAPGEVVAEDPKRGIAVQTGDGLLWLTRLQLPGGKPLDAATFLNGRSLLGQRLGGEGADASGGR